MDIFEKEILIQRVLWYISGTNDFRGLHKDDTLYKDKTVNEKTASRIMEFMSKNNHKLKEEFIPSLNNKIKGLEFQTGVSTGSIWRTYPSHKVNSIFDEIIPGSIGPDVKERMRSLFKIEKIRIDNFREKYQESCERLIKEGKELVMPDPETHRYIDTFPDNSDEYIADRSRYIKDQFYNTLISLKNNKDSILIGYLPEFTMSEALSPDMNLFFNRKPIEEDFISITFSIDNKILKVSSIRNTKSNRYHEFTYMLQLIISMISWCLNIDLAIIDNEIEVKHIEYIKTNLTPSIDNIFKLQIKDFINE